MHMSRDDEHLVPSSSQLPLASNFGQVFIAVLYGVPMSTKTKLLMTQQEQPPQDSSTLVSFLLPTGTSLGLAELVMITASSEMADEVFSCSGSSERMQVLAHDIEHDVDAFTANGRTILEGLELVKKEVKERKKKVSNARVSLAVDEVNRHVNNIKRALRHAGVSDSNLKVLVPLESLMSEDHVHRSHQHWTDDDRERWNLAGF